MVDEPESNAAEEVPIRIASEYATVSVRRVSGESEGDGRDGEYLEISAPKLDHVVRLDASQAAALTRVDKDLFSRLLETPYGPDED